MTIRTLDISWLLIKQLGDVLQSMSAAPPTSLRLLTLCIRPASLGEDPNDGPSPSLCFHGISEMMPLFQNLTVLNIRSMCLAESVQQLGISNQLKIYQVHLDCGLCQHLPRDLTGNFHLLEELAIFFSPQASSTVASFLMHSSLPILKTLELVCKGGKEYIEEQHHISISRWTFFPEVVRHLPCQAIRPLLVAMGNVRTLCQLRII